MAKMGLEGLKSQKLGIGGENNVVLVYLKRKYIYKRFSVYYRKKKPPRASLRSPTTEKMEKKKKKKKKEKKNPENAWWGLTPEARL